MIDIATMGEPVAGLLKECGQTVAVAESSAGGLISAALLAQPGASAYFKGGGAVYTGASKQLLMNLSDEEMTADRAATEPHASRLAEAARARAAQRDDGDVAAAGELDDRWSTQWKMDSAGDSRSPKARLSGVGRKLQTIGAGSPQAAIRCRTARSSSGRFTARAQAA